MYVYLKEYKANKQSKSSWPVRFLANKRTKSSLIRVASRVLYRNLLIGELANEHLIDFESI